MAITYDLRWAGSFEANEKQKKVVNYISANLGDMIWQEEISNQVQRIDKNHISLAIVFRLFRREDIEKSSLKSYARYIQKKDILNIDQILALDEYIELSEDEMRHQLCDTYFNCLEEILIKYKREFGIRECCYNTTSSGQLLTVIPGIDPESSVISVIILMFQYWIPRLCPE